MKFTLDQFGEVNEIQSKMKVKSVIIVLLSERLLGMKVGGTWQVLLFLYPKLVALWLKFSWQVETSNHGIGRSLCSLMSTLNELVILSRCVWCAARIGKVLVRFGNKYC